MRGFESRDGRQEAGCDVRRETATAEEGGISCDIVTCAHAYTRRVLDDFWSVSVTSETTISTAKCVSKYIFYSRNRDHRRWSEKTMVENRFNYFAEVWRERTIA